MRFIRLLALALAIPSGARAQNVADDPRVSQAPRLMRVWLEAQRAYTYVPGVSAALVSNQQVLWSGGFGPAVAYCLFSNRHARSAAAPGTQ